MKGSAGLKAWHPILFLKLSKLIVPPLPHFINAALSADNICIEEEQITVEQCLLIIKIRIKLQRSISLLNIVLIYALLPDEAPLSYNP